MHLVEDGYEPTMVPITLGRGAYLLHIKLFHICTFRYYLTIESELV